MPDSLTNDEPYIPDMDPADVAEIITNTQPAAQALSTRFAEGNKSTRDAQPISPARRAYQERLDLIMDKMAKGEELNDKDAAFATDCAMMLVLRESRRPSHHLKAAALLQNGRIKRLIERTVHVEHEDVTPKGPRPSLPR